MCCAKGSHCCHIPFTWHILTQVEDATSVVSGLSSHLTASVGAMAPNLERISVRYSNNEAFKPSDTTNSTQHVS